MSWYPLSGIRYGFLESLKGSCKRIMVRLRPSKYVAPGHVVIHPATIGRMLNVVPLTSNVWLSPAISNHFPDSIANAKVGEILLHPVLDQPDEVKEYESTDVETDELVSAFWKHVVDSNTLCFNTGECSNFTSIDTSHGAAGKGRPNG